MFIFMLTFFSFTLENTKIYLLIHHVSVLFPSICSYMAHFVFLIDINWGGETGKIFLFSDLRCLIRFVISSDFMNE